MVGALGGRAGGAVASRATVRGGPAWWVFRAGFVRHFDVLRFWVCRVVQIGVVGRAVVHASVWSRG